MAKQVQSTGLTIRPGLHPYLIPIKRNQFGREELKTEKACLEELDAICESITEQGGRLVGVGKISVHYQRPGTVGGGGEERTILFIEKAHTNESSEG